MINLSRKTVNCSLARSNQFTRSLRGVKGLDTNRICSLSSDINRFVVHQKPNKSIKYPDMHSTSVYLFHIGLVSASGQCPGAATDPDSLIRVQTWDRVFDLTFSLATALWDTGRPQAGQLASQAWWGSHSPHHMDTTCLKPTVVHSMCTYLAFSLFPKGKDNYIPWVDLIIDWPDNVST